MKSPLVLCASLLLLGILAYSNTMQVPFFFDDAHTVVNNPIIRDMAYFFNPASAGDFPGFGLFVRRYVSFLTFAANYALHGDQLMGYHLLNLAIHLGCALLVFAFISQLFQTPALAASSLARQGRLVGFLSALLFVAHPVQVEAVTYITQRMASLAALFSLLTLVLYGQSRLADSRRLSLSLAFLSFLAATMAVLSKENALTLPLVVILYEALFFRAPLKRALVRVLPFTLVWLVYLAAMQLSGISATTAVLGTGGEETAARSALSTFDSDYLDPGQNRWPYLITQIRVLVTYLRLLVAPINQVFLYDYPLYTTLFSFQVLAGLLLHSSLLALAIFCMHRSRKGEPALLVAGFGILWFFVTLAVESSFLPIPLLICEYRLYLPSIGIFAMVVTLAMLLGQRGTWSRRLPPILLAAAAVLLGLATYQRNTVWQDKVTMWEDIVTKSKATSQWRMTRAQMDVRYNLANAYRLRGEGERALELYKEAIRLNPANIDARNNIGVILMNSGQLQEAIGFFKQCISMQPGYFKAYANLGICLLKADEPQQAIYYLQRSLSLKPSWAQAYLYLGEAYMMQKDFVRAEQAFQIYGNAVRDPEEAKSAFEKMERARRRLFEATEAAPEESQ